VILSRLKIKSVSRKYLDSIYKTLHPDNTVLPRGMTLSEKLEEHKETYVYIIDINVPCGSKNFDSMRGALDEILTIISMIENISRRLK